MSEKHHVIAPNAAKFWDWLQHRGGLAVWESINLSNPGASWTTPATHTDGSPATKPTWEAANTPARIITDPADVVVDVPKLMKRFHIAVRVGSQGMALKLTDASSDRVRREVAKAGDDAWHEFDYDTQEALIFVPDTTVPITDYMESLHARENATTEASRG